MNYLARLKQLDNGEIFHHTPKLEPTKPTEPPFDGFVGLIPGANENIYGGSNARKVSPGNTATASRWWLIHFPDGAPLEAWANPPATWTEILERHPDAVAAEPFNQTAQVQATACATCTHATYRGGCGVPVAAGLSDLDGVICYHDEGGKDCTAWLATIPSDLETLIQRSGTFYEYGPEDFELIRQVARFDPDDLRLALNYFLNEYQSHAEAIK